MKIYFDLNYDEWEKRLKSPRAKVIYKTFGIMAIVLVFFNAGRSYEQDFYEHTIESPYPLKAQSYFGGISTSHIKNTW